MRLRHDISGRPRDATRCSALSRVGHEPGQAIASDEGWPLARQEGWLPNHSSPRCRREWVSCVNCQFIAPLPAGLATARVAGVSCERQTRDSTHSVVASSYWRASAKTSLTHEVHPAQLESLVAKAECVACMRRSTPCHCVRAASGSGHHASLRESCKDASGARIFRF